MAVLQSSKVTFMQHQRAESIPVKLPQGSTRVALKRERQSQLIFFRSVECSEGAC